MGKLGIDASKHTGLVACLVVIGSTRQFRAAQLCLKWVVDCRARSLPACYCHPASPQATLPGPEAWASSRLGQRSHHSKEQPKPGECPPLSPSLSSSQRGVGLRDGSSIVVKQQKNS